MFPIKNLVKVPTLEPTPEVATEPTKHNLKLQWEFINEVIANEKMQIIK